MSSVLYRRLAADPDAPVIAVGGKFWLRGRPLPSETVTALRPAIRHARRVTESDHDRRRRSAIARRVTPLPEPPPLALPIDVQRLIETPALSAGRRERAVTRLADRLQHFARTHVPTDSQRAQWEADHTFRKLVAPLLTLLGYRRVAQQPVTASRGRLARRLEAGGRQDFLLDVVRVGHDLGDADARSTLARAASLSVRWALLTNGREIRLYAPALLGALQNPASALVFRVDLHDDAFEQAAHLLWLLTRTAVLAGALEAYLASRAVGAAFLHALDDPDSALVRALVDAVQAITGLEVQASLVARHARVALREERGRDGEPRPEDIPAVAAIVEAPSVASRGEPARIAS